MKNSLSLERVKEFLEYNPKTGNFVWIKRINSQSRAKIGAVAGWKKSGYKCIALDGVKYYCHRLAWFYIHGKWPENEIDHINGVKDDNRLSNLRDVTHKENLQNRRKANSNNESGFLGVKKCANSYSARIGSKSLGVFNNPVQAHKAYLKAKRELHEGCTI